MDNIDEEYDRLVEHLQDCTKNAESFKTTKRRLSLETLELIRQRGAAGNQELTSALARRGKASAGSGRATTVLLYKNGDPHDIGNYRPVCLLYVIYKLFTRVIPNSIEKVLDEGQSCEQAGFRKGFSMIDHIHTVSKLIELSREYKMPLCLTFIDLRKAFDSVETEAVMKPWTTKALLST
ncbi:hypothetical protein RB195_024247 [Necator americanus]|uniref:Reverse transcriptase domain-containing protein n=1 Tax=Necator americanus TaxID=51031 RepID=A0ABR1EPS4_NECAM